MPIAWLQAHHGWTTTWCSRLTSVARWSRGTSPQRHNITNPLARSLAGGTGLPRLDTSRLRATWLADCARLIGPATFLQPPGSKCIISRVKFPNS
jgi:hypothetical protein